MANYIVPVIFLTIFVYALVKKIPLYNCFTEGIKSALKLVADIFPFIAAIFIAVELLNISGISDILTQWLSPVFGFFGIPKELTKLMILRPLSGKCETKAKTKINKANKLKNMSKIGIKTQNRLV